MIDKDVCSNVDEVRICDPHLLCYDMIQMYYTVEIEMCLLRVFTSLALFALLISPLNSFPWVINGLVESHVSLKRVQRFINIEPTCLDEYYENVPLDPQLSLGIVNDISGSYILAREFLDTVFLNSLDHPSLDMRINQGSYSWNVTDSIESDNISLKDIDLTITRGSLVLIL